MVVKLPGMLVVEQGGGVVVAASPRRDWSL